ncbi:MAG: flagellar hook-basal body complex protein FliE [Chitinispirillia bacterium]|nr:flagellar hook-basal body complex protein FliE [Chitinispirillia bacterium]MCL2241324.1 flagellar hook-basal body complex protein FliE [Chitinispirillia bacterium]
MEGIDALGPVQGGSLPRSVGPTFRQDGVSGGLSFKETLNGFLGDVNQLQKQADESVKKLASGEITDVHQVMTASEEAKVAFNLMMEIRNKVMEAYQEVMRIRL